MNPYSSSVSKCLFARPEKPSSKFFTAILRLDLFILFDIVTDNKTRSVSLPFLSSDTLLSASSNNTELIPIRALNDDIHLLVGDKALDLKVTTQIVILLEFTSDVSKVFDSQFFCGSDNHYVLFYSKDSIGDAEVVGETCALGVVSRGSEGNLRGVRTVLSPHLPMEVGGGLRIVVALTEVGPRQRFDMFGVDLHLGGEA